MDMTEDIKLFEVLLLI